MKPAQPRPSPEFIPWSTTLETGFAEVDAQHRELVRIINVLHAASAGGEGSEPVRRTLTQLADYASVHFLGEERLLEQTGYAYLGEHRREHNAFIEQVVELCQQEDVGALVGEALLGFLKTWLVNHIMDSDQRYVPFLQAHGIR